MALQGEDLGVELGKVYHAGNTLLPKVAGDVYDAWLNTPAAISGDTRRGGGIGKDPGAVLDTMLEHINTMTYTTQQVLHDVGAALVVTANDFATTDSNVHKAFTDEKKALGDV